MGLAFYITDLETNGLRVAYHSVTEVSIIRVADKRQLTHMIRCEYPERSNFDSLKITGKTLADLELGISKEEAVAQINKFLEEDGLTPAHRCFVGHNVVSFDKRFYHDLYDQTSTKLPVDLWLDTMTLMRKFVKANALGKQKINLHAACDLVGVKKIAAARHSAKMDSRNTYLLWEKLKEYQIDYLPDIKTFQHIPKAIEQDHEQLLAELNELEC